MIQNLQQNWFVINVKDIGEVTLNHGIPLKKITITQIITIKSLHFQTM